MFKKINMFIISIIFIKNASIFANIEWAHSNKDDGWRDREAVRLYHYSHEIQRLWIEKSMANTKINRFKSILDFGCGDGSYSITLALRAPKARVRGIDISEQMISFAKKKYSSDNLSFGISEDIHFENTPKDLYDLVVSSSVMHLIPDPLKALTNINKSMKRNGFLVMAYPCDTVEYLQAVKTVFKKYKISPPNKNAKKGKLRIRDIDDAKTILTKAGFEIIELKKYKDRVRFVDIKDFLDWSNGTTSKNWGLKTENQDFFHRDFIDTYKSLDSLAFSKEVFQPKLFHISVIAKKS